MLLTYRPVFKSSQLNYTLRREKRRNAKMAAIRLCCLICISCTLMFNLQEILWATLHFHLIERFSFECRKTKIKVITLTNHISRKQSSEPVRAEANTCSRRQARENAYRQVTIGFGLLLIGRESGARFFSQSGTVAMQNQSNCEITRQSIETRSISNTRKTF